MNGLELLLADHAIVRERFASFVERPTGAVAGEIFDLLLTHDDAERSALYPLVAQLVDAEAADRARTEHLLVEKLVDRARGEEGDALVRTMAALRTAVDEHVEREENDLFPRLTEAAGPDDLDRLAARLQQTKQRVG